MNPFHKLWHWLNSQPVDGVGPVDAGGKPIPDAPQANRSVEFQEWEIEHNIPLPAFTNLPDSGNSPKLPKLAPQPQKEITAMSWLSTLGKDFKGIFSWLGSPKGQTVIATGEAVAEAVGAPAAVINLGNYWLGKILAIESSAAAAGTQNGTGTQKAAAVLTDVTPLVLSVAKQNGLPTPTADQINAANTALVAFLNALGAKEVEVPATPAN